MTALLLLALACGPDATPTPIDTAAPDGAHACSVVIREPGVLGEDPEDLPVGTPHVGYLSDQPGPYNLRLGIHDDPSVDATLMWRTDLSTLATRVRLQGPGGVAFVDGASFPTPDDTSRLHEVHLCGLVPATEYVYKVGGHGAWSEQHGFTTAPDDPSASVRLVVLGDSRDDLETWTQLMYLGWAWEPDLLLHTGDVVALGGLQSLWDEWFAASEGLLAEVPMVVDHGNHEFMAPNFFGSFAMPGSEQWFAVDWGALHLVVLNDMATGDDADEQAAWLAQDVVNADRSWYIPSHHQPSWTDGNHVANTDARDEWNPLFEPWAPTVVLAGHNHLYERTVPIVGEVQDESGVTYVTTGGAGAPLYGTGSDWFLAVTESTYHYMVIDFTEVSLEATAYRLDGTVLDTFSFAR